MSWRNNLIKIDPYVAGEQPDKADYIKLNANENPYPPSPAVIKAIAEFGGAGLCKYPDAEVKPIADVIAKKLGLRRENVYIGNGSDDVLQLAFRAFFNSDKPVLFPDVTYSFYPVWCELVKIHYETLPVDDDFNINTESYKRPNGGIVICNPNAPTSIGRGLGFIREILDSNRESVVIVDEAYVDFGGESAVPLLREYDNLCIAQTFSKCRSMAGMRIGCALGSEELISALYSAKGNSYPVDSVAIAAGVASLLDEEYFRATIEKVVFTRKRLTAVLREMGFDVPDSSTNFVFAEHSKYRARDIFEHLKSRDIYVRYFNKPRIDNRLRITVGTDRQIDALISALSELIK